MATREAPRRRRASSSAAMPVASLLTRRGLAAGSRPRSRKRLPMSMPAKGRDAHVFLSCTRSPVATGTDRLSGSNTPAPGIEPQNGRADPAGGMPPAGSADRKGVDRRAPRPHQCTATSHVQGGCQSSRARAWRALAPAPGRGVRGWICHPTNPAGVSVSTNTRPGFFVAVPFFSIQMQFLWGASFEAPARDRMRATGKPSPHPGGCGGPRCA